MRMVQRGNGARFTLEALFELRILTKMSGQNLNRDRAIQARVPSAIHFTHPASA